MRVKILQAEEYMKDLHSRARNNVRFWDTLKSHYREEYYNEVCIDNSYGCENIGWDCELDPIEVFNRVEMFKNYLVKNDVLVDFMHHETDLRLVDKVLLLNTPIELQ